MFWNQVSSFIGLDSAWIRIRFHHILWIRSGYNQFRSTSLKKKTKNGEIWLKCTIYTPEEKCKKNTFKKITRKVCCNEVTKQLRKRKGRSKKRRKERKKKGKPSAASPVVAFFGGKTLLDLVYLDQGLIFFSSNEQKKHK